MSGFTQKTYACVLRFKGDVQNTLPLAGVTKHELQLLAFMHGIGSVVEVRFTGLHQIEFPTGDEPTFNEAGVPILRYVETEMEEFRRLARKYDTVVNSGRGRKAVEECFRTRIEDFDAIVAEVDARASMEKAAELAEAEAALKAGGEGHERVVQEVAASGAPPTAPVGQRFAASASPPRTS